MSRNDQRRAFPKCHGDSGPDFRRRVSARISGLDEQIRTFGFIHFLHRLRGDYKDLRDVLCNCTISSQVSNVVPTFPRTRAGIIQYASIMKDLTAPLNAKI